MEEPKNGGPRLISIEEEAAARRYREARVLGQ